MKSAMTSQRAHRHEDVTDDIEICHVCCGVDAERQDRADRDEKHADADTHE